MRLPRQTNAAALTVGLGLVLPVSATSQFEGRILARESDLLPTYDYVIVGGGVSGLAVANRLSENERRTVLVIEAGELDQDEDFITIPGLAGGAIGTKYDWNLTYVTNPSVENRTVAIPQGKIVGGSSQLNRMVLDRGSSADYDRWRNLGNSGWGWSDLLPFFKNSETFSPPTKEIRDEWNVTYDLSVHGSTGYTHSSYAPWIWPATKHFINAMNQTGINTPRDGASGDAVGAFFVTHAQDPTTATRSGARKAYWDTVSNRTGLHMITGKRATRLITKKTGHGPKITGVEFAASASAPRTIVNVHGEAILAAGAIHTPQLLLLSGIGDSTALAALNISTVADVPGVGHNFQDHVRTTAVFEYDFPLVGTNLTDNATFAAESLALYHANKTGPYADSTGDFLAFLPAQNFTSETASLHKHAFAQDPKAYLDPSTPASVQRGYALQHKLLTAGIPAPNQAQLEIIWTDGINVLGLQHPFSRGSVRLASSDPFVAPLADSAFLRNPLDVQILLAALKYSRTLARTPALAAFNPVEASPGANVTEDADLERYIRGAADTLFHPSGSAAVGRFELGGVVDEDFRVYGVKGLRVVDASVLPMLPATHIQSSVAAVAEKAADAIKASWFS